MAGMSLVKSDESHARRLANCRASFSPEAPSDGVFVAIASPLSRSRCPDLEQLRDALSHKHRETAFEARREGNQVAGISEISGFAARRPVGRAAQLLPRRFPSLRQSSAAPALGPRACVE